MKIVTIIIPVLLTLLGAIFPPEAEAKRLFKESVYQEVWCSQQGGIAEVRLPDRTRVDCLTQDFAIEMDFADKWAESIGQALHYASQTGQMPGIVLIVESDKERRFVDRVNNILNRYLLKIRVWVITPNIFEEEK